VFCLRLEVKHLGFKSEIVSSTCLDLNRVQTRTSIFTNSPTKGWERFVIFATKISHHCFFSYNVSIQ
jgi:hypothetical protein